MLKVRLMGTARDIKWFKKILIRDSRIDLLSISDMLPYPNSNKYHRMYAEVQKNEKEK